MSRFSQLQLFTLVLKIGDADDSGYDDADDDDADGDDADDVCKITFESPASMQ